MSAKLTIQRGLFRGRSLRLPPEVGGHRNLTPAFIKEAVFQILENRVEARHAFFDLCAGSGQMGFEALSLEYHSVHLCEVDPRRFSFIVREVREHAYSVHLHKKDFRRMGSMIQDCPHSVSFLDPPYSFWSRDGCEAIDQFLNNLLTFTARPDGQPDGQPDEPHQGLLLIQGPRPYQFGTRLKIDPQKYLQPAEFRNYRGNHLTLLDFRLKDSCEQ